MNNPSHPHLDHDAKADAGQEGKHKPNESFASPDRSIMREIAWLVAGLALTSVVLTSPLWILMLLHRGDAPAPRPQGTVQKIRFVGSFGITSQVDTERRSFLVRGVTSLHRGARVELRKGVWAVQLCEADSDLCEDLMKDE